MGDSTASGFFLALAAMLILLFVGACGYKAGYRNGYTEGYDYAKMVERYVDELAKGE